MNQRSTTLNHQQIIESAWRDQAIWSETANSLKAGLSRWRYRAAVAGVLGAFLETAAAFLSRLGQGWWWLQALIALAGAIILAVVPYVVRTKVSKERVAEWVRARSASESLKDLIYRYLVGVPPFGETASPSDLIDRCQSIKDKVQSLQIYAASAEPPPKVRPLTLTVEEYIEKRVDDQIERYYRPKGREKAFAAKRLHDWEFGLGIAAVVLGVLASAGAAAELHVSFLGPWVAVVTTASAAVTAHLAGSRYDHESMIYFGTADRLSGLRDKWLCSPDRMDPACISKFVDDCEHAISTENEEWLVKWARDQSEKSVDPPGRP